LAPATKPVQQLAEKEAVVRALFLEKPRHAVIREVERPECGEHDALIEVHASGICGSDVHTYRGHHPFRKPPVVLGHEVAGKVVEIGRSVERVKIGDRVAVEPHLYCGMCRFCTEGLPNLCRDKRVPGHGWAGTFSEWIVAPAKVLHKLADSVSYEEGSMLEPTAVAYRAFRTGGISMGRKVAVLGAGTIGSLVAHLCQKTRVSRLMVTDIKEYNLNFIRSLGPCTPVDAATEDVVERGRLLAGGQGFDTVVVTSGSKDSLTEATRLCRPQGTIVVIALYPGEVSVDVNGVVTSELNIRGSLTYTSNDFRETVDLVNSGAFDVRPFITQRIGLDEAPGVLEKLDKGFDCIKAMIDLSERKAKTSDTDGE
jgi:L-iditol 2-dehydrogenase